MPTSVDEVAVTDGRLLRSERTRNAIVDALLDLVREGDVRPSSAAIAERAGVTQRTLFNQFGDMESLLGAASLRLGQRIGLLLPGASEGDLDERVEQFSNELAVLLDEVMNVRWAVLTNPALLARRQAPDLLRMVMRNQLEVAFQPELGGLDDEVRGEWLDLLEVEADPLTWRIRRLQQDLSTEDARRQVARVMLVVLRAAAAAGSSDG